MVEPVIEHGQFATQHLKTCAQERKLKASIISFMPLLEIVHYPDPVLLKVGRPVDEDEFGHGLQTTIDAMFATMHAAGGVGLAAPQVGLSKRFFVMDVKGDDGQPRPTTLINPEIIHVEGEQTADEGCLSFPGLFQSISREMRVVVRANDVKGEIFELDLTGLAARCVLHETDHCDGIVFLDRMSPLKRELAKRKIKRLQSTGEWVDEWRSKTPNLQPR
jgi:peptide deformylase